MESDDVDNPISPCPGACDIAIPVVYPHQPIFIPADAVRDAIPFDIDVEASLRATFSEPDSIPPLSVLEENETGVRVLGLGHAGIVIVDGRSGGVRYYEYGRYDPAQFGQVRMGSEIGDLVIAFGQDGNPRNDSLIRLASMMTRTNGGPYACEAIYVKLANGAFDVMKEFAENRMMDIREKRADPYDVAGNHCFTFAMEVAESAGINVDVSNSPILEVKLRGGNFFTRGVVGWAAPDFEVPARQIRTLQQRYQPLTVSSDGFIESDFSFPKGINSR